MADELLGQRPVRRYAYEDRNDADDCVRVIIPRLDGGIIEKFIGLLFPRRDQKLNLDAFGSFVYVQCDGTRSVQEIAGLLKERFGDTVEPLEGRLTLFIQELFRRNLITFVRDG